MLQNKSKKFQAFVRQLSQEQFEESKENFLALSRSESQPDEPNLCLICKRPSSSYDNFKKHFMKMHPSFEIDNAFRNCSKNLSEIGL